MTSKKRVLIVSYSFPPLNHIAARRFGWMCKYLEDFSWEPYILTTNSEGPLQVHIPENQCIRVGEHHQAKAKIDEKYYKWKPDLNPLVNVLRKLVKLRFHSLDASTFGWYKTVRNQFKDIVKSLPEIDVVIGTYGPSASILIARKLSKTMNVPWVADFRDLAAMRIKNRSRGEVWIDKNIERILLRSASGITSVSKVWSDAMSDAHGKPARTIYNGFDESLLNSQNSSPDHHDPGVIETAYIHFAGTLYPQRLNSFLLLLEALAELGEDHNIQFLLRSLGPASMENKIEKYSNELGIENRVRILPPIDPKPLAVEQQRALANVVVAELSKEDPLSSGLMTGKFLQLLPNEVPILSICRSDNVMTEILDNTKRGKSCSRVDEITDFLSAVKNSSFNFQGDMETLSQYNYRSQARELGDFLNSIVNSHRED